jgi:hypothetical protein
VASTDMDITQDDPNALVAEELRLRLVSANADLGPGPHDTAPLRAFVCECGCNQPISMSLRAYERIRRNGEGVVAPGHDASRAVLRRESAFWVVKRAA